MSLPNLIPNVIAVVSSVTIASLRCSVHKAHVSDSCLTARRSSLTALLQGGSKYSSLFTIVVAGKQNEQYRKLEHFD